MPDPVYSEEVIGALFGFIHSLASTNHGAIALRSSGLIASLLPLLQASPAAVTMTIKQLQLVMKSLSIIELFLDYDDSAVDLFRELGGISDLAKRIAAQVDFIESKTSGKDDISQIDKDEGILSFV